MTKYSPELAEDVCSRVANGESITAIAEHYGLNRNTIHKWISKNPEFERSYAQARLVAAEFLIEDAEKRLESAKNKLDVLIAKEVLNQARWKAEKLLPQYKVRSEQTVINATPTVVGWLDSVELAEVVVKLATALEALGGDSALISEARGILSGEERSIN